MVCCSALFCTGSLTALKLCPSVTLGNETPSGVSQFGICGIAQARKTKNATMIIFVFLATKLRDTAHHFGLTVIVGSMPVILL